MSSQPAKLEAWNKLFDDMIERDKTITEQQIYELLYPLVWDPRQMDGQNEQVKQEAIATYREAVAMNLRIRDRINSLCRADQTDQTDKDVVPDLFRCFQLQPAKDNIMAGRLAPYAVYFSNLPQFQYGHYGVAVNSSRVQLTGRDANVCKNNAVRVCANRELKLDFSTDVIFALRVEDTLNLQQELIKWQEMINQLLIYVIYDILTISLLNVMEFDRFCLEYNHPNLTEVGEYNQSKVVEADN